MEWQTSIEIFQGGEVVELSRRKLERVDGNVKSSKFGVSFHPLSLVH